ncbi:uncharacterized protein LOC132300824 [Cornus florida]|uniref:uncharacterized protein LOC132300824 n=1 Tax=Cornus florida TaxID=4283 RepID=UPI002898FCCF|nr:uncharacterized protein LOC132300824 [Cornus florida]
MKKPNDETVKDSQLITAQIAVMNGYIPTYSGDKAINSHTTMKGTALAQSGGIGGSRLLDGEQTHSCASCKRISLFRGRSVLATEFQTNFKTQDCVEGIHLVLI